MSNVTDHDLAQLGEICSKICYHLTAHIKAVADGTPPSGTSDIAKLYQLALALPAPTEAQWAALAGHAPARAAKPAAAPAGTPTAPLAEGAERAPGKRLKWTQQLETELVQLVEDEEFRKEKLGGWGARGRRVVCGTPSAQTLRGQLGPEAKQKQGPSCQLCSGCHAACLAGRGTTFRSLRAQGLAAVVAD